MNQPTLVFVRYSVEYSLLRYAIGVAKLNSTTTCYNLDNLPI